MSRLRAWLRGLPVSWPTVVAIAVVVTLADVFVMVSLERTVGAIERRQPPFQLWLRASLVLLPLFLAAAVGALGLTRRSMAAGQRRSIRTGSGLVAVIGVTFLLALLVTAANSGYDYYIQVHHLNQSAHLKHITYRIINDTPVLIGNPDCNATCVGKAATVNMHLRGLGLAAGVLLVVNAVLVLWTFALCGGRLWVPEKARRAALLTDTDTVADPGTVPALA